MQNEHKMAQKDAPIDSFEERMKALYARMQNEEQKNASQLLFEASDWELNQVKLTSNNESLD